MLYRYLLLVRFALYNVVAVAGLAAVYLQGWVDPVIEADLLELSGVIVLLFLYGFLLSAHLVWRTSIDLNAVKLGTVPVSTVPGRYLGAIKSADGESRDVLRGVLRLKLTGRIAIVRHVANSLVFLGLIGTVIGFIIALAGVDPIGASNAERTSEMVTKLITGMSVALNTTLVGAMLHVWLIVNYRLLTTGTINLLTATLEAGETQP